MSDNSQQANTGTPSQDRYRKLLKGEISSEQYVKSLQKEARAADARTHSGDASSARRKLWIARRLPTDLNHGL